MEAQTLPKKKTISKGKIKKSIKNVLCRPDPLHWPQISEDESRILEAEISKYKIKIPEFKKPHWKEIKDIEKSKRPKPPPLPKVEGVIFGMTECLNAIRKGQCWAVIIEAMVEPRTMVQPTVEACVIANIPVICMVDLKKVSANNFGIGTSCLSIKNNHLPDLRNVILTISHKYQVKKISQNQTNVEPMDVEVTKQNQNIVTNDSKKACLHLYRSNNKSRVFVPSGAVLLEKKDFSGQGFIRFTDSLQPQSKNGEFMKMTLKRILGNPNRVKRKKN